MKKLFIVLFVCTLFYTNKAKSQSSTYVVLTSISDTTDSYYQAVLALKNYRNAQVIQFNPSDVNAILPTLISAAPRYVAVVVKPIELYINFVRQFLMMSTNVDSDPFSDFSYGFITGATGQDALNFVNNIINAESQNIQNFPLNVGGCVASSLNFVYNYPGDYLTYLNPNNYSQIYMETNNSGTGTNFFLSNTNSMMNKKLLDIGHNGDPHMIWLFEGGNSTPTPPVWLYDSTKIENPAYARVGLSSYNISPLNFYPAVAFNGACHSGEPKKVMVEGDIAATFGDTQWQEKFYTMSDSFSFALSILKTGITGYFAPCGANNANDQSEEIYNAFLFHEPLGDIHKRSVDGVVMGFLGNRPNLKMYVDGAMSYGSDILSSGTFDPNDWSGAYSMLGGKANRVYFGDPLFNPYQNNYSDSLNITKAVIDSISSNYVNITVSFIKPDASIAYFPVWEKFHFGDTRIYIPIELPAWISDISTFSVIDSSGPYYLVIHSLEHFNGKTILHVEVDIPDDMYSAINYNITFGINVITTRNENIITEKQNISIFPNPSVTHTTINFSNPNNESFSLIIFNLIGQIVSKIDGIKNNSIRINTKDLKSGVYFFQLQNQYGIAGNGKFIRE